MNAFRRTGFVVLVLVICLYSVAPFVWELLTSFKTLSEATTVPPTYLPREPSVEGYRLALGHAGVTRGWLNSLLVAGASTVLCLLIGSLAAYSLARLRPRGSGVILRSILAIAVFPTIVLLLPLYQLLRQLGLLGTPFCLILCYTTINMPFVVWVLTSFFSEIPEEIEDAARVDGFSRLGIWARVIIPLSAPALATTAILVFIFSWNEFLLAHTFVGETEWATIPVALSRIGGSTAHDVPINAISAGVVLSTLPLVVAVVILQRKIVEGLTAGAVKG